MVTTDIKQSEKTKCFHCGDHCDSEQVVYKDKTFCCQGCQTVYEILQSNELQNYYKLETEAGIRPSKDRSHRFDYLDDESIQEQLYDFRDESIAKVQFYIPQIHCSSCIWLLENIYKLNPAIYESRVHFLKKKVFLSFNHNKTSLKAVVKLLSSLGYQPDIRMDQLKKSKKRPIPKRLIYQVGLAGFAFGNIMLFSLPEYLGMDWGQDQNFVLWFGWLNLIFATPVAIYSGQDYFKSAWYSLRQGRLNIDVPIALGIFVLYARSAYEIISHSGAGYFDSLCGLLFYLLLGRIFQERIYHQLSFERDYRSYFPISLVKIVNGQEKSVAIQQIKKGDRILIRNGELIPVDAYLIKGNAKIDNSFATGESKPIQQSLGSKIYAGGRQVGEAIELEVIRPLSQSKLTRLWSDYAKVREKDQEERVSFSQLTDQISQWFTPIILIIAVLAAIYHWSSGLGHTIEVVTAVLIIACPCALALAAPFTFGHSMRFLGRESCYLRDASVIEKMNSIDKIIFDKTGTLTYNQNREVKYQGASLTRDEKKDIQLLFSQSNHPLSRIIGKSLPKSTSRKLENFTELTGKGLSAIISGKKYRLGAAQWLNHKTEIIENSHVYVEINQTLKGFFEVSNTYRKGLNGLLKKLDKNYSLAMLSGDQSGQKKELTKLFPKDSELLFNQSPNDKLHYIKNLQAEGKKCMMVGDGLNDAGALLQADVGISIAEDVNAFSPACDVILDAKKFNKLNAILSFAKDSKKIIIASFVISFLYNLIGLSFAVQGMLSPVFAAILMPLSSITVVGFVSIAVWAKKGQRLA